MTRRLGCAILIKLSLRQRTLITEQWNTYDSRKFLYIRPGFCDPDTFESNGHMTDKQWIREIARTVVLRDHNFHCSDRRELRWHTFYQRVWSWLRMNAGGVPNTCKSNGPYNDRDFGRRSFKVSGGRVSNAWRTCPVLGDNSEKLLLIPHKRTGPHGPEWKTPVVQDGSALD